VATKASETIVRITFHLKKGRKSLL
jgi:hypothetical protein